MKKLSCVLLAVAFVFMFTGIVLADNDCGRKLRKLKKQIKEIQEQLDGLSTNRGSVRVYDADGQYLGILLANPYPVTSNFINGLGTQIFSEEAGQTFIIMYATEDILDSMSNRYGIWYATSDCTGQAYTNSSISYGTIMQKTRDWQPHPYYIVHPGYDNPVTAYSEKGSRGECVELPAGSYKQYGFIIEEIPVEKITFNHPVKFPLVFELE